MAGRDLSERGRVGRGRAIPKKGAVGSASGRTPPASGSVGSASGRTPPAKGSVGSAAGRGGATAATGSSSTPARRGPAAVRAAARASGAAAGARGGSLAGRVAGRVGGALAGILAPTRAADAELPRGMGGRASSGPVSRGRRGAAAPETRRPARTARPAPKSNGEESADYLTQNAWRGKRNAKEMAKKVMEDRANAKRNK